jgi:hypothetical protein
MDLAGTYPADRAASLSGVPKSTVHYWARTELLVPSVSPERIKLWSFTDLLALRTIYWLRQPKTKAGREVPPSKMHVVRRALRRLRQLDLEMFDDGRPIVAITSDGDVVIAPPGRTPETSAGQLLDPARIFSGRARSSASFHRSSLALLTSSTPASKPRLCTR